MAVTHIQPDFLYEVAKTFEQSNLDFARAYYLFATAKLSETYNSTEIYKRYPLLSSEETFQQLKQLYDQNPADEELKRYFTSVLDTYIGNQLASLSDELQNLKNQLKIDVQGLNIVDKTGQILTELLYEDVPEWLKKLEDKAARQELYNRMSQAYLDHIATKYIELFNRGNALLAELGYPDVVAFYSQTSGHQLVKLGDSGKKLVEQTENLYRERMETFYKQRTGVAFAQATRADISYVFHGKSPEMADIDARFNRENLLPLATKTFDGLGLNYSRIAQTVDFQSIADFEKTVKNTGDSSMGPLRRILLDVTQRSGKRSRAYVYPANVPSEIYLSVKPEGGLDDYSAFFHESGHALHFAYEDPNLSFAMALMGNNTVTESYAYLLQNLFLNRHWLENMAGLSPEESLRAVCRGALNDLYMLRRYASKMQFELKLYDGKGLEGKDQVYADLLTHGTGFQYDPEGWSRDVDAGFYVADYLTAWMLEAQLREYLCTQFGTPTLHGEDWYQNPKAGEFLKNLWKDGNLTQQDLSNRLGYNDPTDVGPLLRLMAWNLG